MSLSYEKHLASLMNNGQLVFQAPLSQYTTMRVGGPADVLAEPADEEELLRLLHFGHEASIPYCMIGNGSNVLFPDEGFHGLVLHIGRQMGAIVCKDNRIMAQAGALLSSVARVAKEHSLQDLEFAAGIPGSTGGAVCMNAGAYGGEMQQVISSARVYCQGKILTLSNAELDFGYRHSSVMAQGGIVLSAEFELTPGNPDEIEAKISDFAQRRRAKQPLQFPSCGSFFKRPQGHFAGALIEEAGLKGFSIGGAQVSPLHAGFIVNTGSATAADVLALMKHVQETVFKQFQVMLEPEVRLLGEFEK